MDTQDWTLVLVALYLGNSLGYLDQVWTLVDVLDTQDWTLVLVAFNLGNSLGMLDIQNWTLVVTQDWTLVVVVQVVTLGLGNSLGLWNIQDWTLVIMLVNWDTALVDLVIQVVDNVARDVPSQVAVPQGR